MQFLASNDWRVANGVGDLRKCGVFVQELGKWWMLDGGMIKC